MVLNNLCTCILSCTTSLYVVLYMSMYCVFSNGIFFFLNHGLYIFKCKCKVTKSYRLFSIHTKCWLNFLLIEGYPNCIGFQNWESYSLWYTCTSIHTFQLTLNSKNRTTFFIFPNTNKQLCHSGMKTRGIFFFSFAFKRIFNIWYLSFIFLSASSRTHIVFFG